MPKPHGIITIFRRPSPKCDTVSLEEAQTRSDIYHRSLFLLDKPLPDSRHTSPYTAPKPILDFSSHMLGTHLIPRDIAAKYDEIKYRGI